MATKAKTKKTPAKKTTFTSAKAAPVKSSASESVSVPRNKYIIIAVVLAIIAIVLAFKYRGLFVAATVNGQPISRVAVVRETEKQAGKQTINNLVRNALIEQEAKKENVTVSEKEIDDEIKKVESNLSKQGQKLDQVLTMQGINRDELRKLIRLDKLVGKMVGKDIKVTDQEISDYIEKNREALGQEQSEEQMRKTVGDQLKQQKLSSKVQKWLSDLQSKAKIDYFVSY